MTQRPQEQLSTLRALARLIPFARPVLPRLAAGFASALGAAIVSLVIPIVLQITVDGPIAQANIALIIWASLGVLALGVLEALFVFLRRAFVLTPATFPTSHEAFARAVVPELQRRGLFRTAYRGRTLREHLRE